MKKTVEYYRLWEDHTWDTDYIEIDIEIDDDPEEAVRNAAMGIKWESEIPVLVGLYYFPEDEEEDDEEEDDE